MSTVERLYRAREAQKKIEVQRFEEKHEEESEAERVDASPIGQEPGEVPEIDRGFSGITIVQEIVVNDDRSVGVSAHDPHKLSSVLEETIEDDELA